MGLNTLEKVGVVAALFLGALGVAVLVDVHTKSRIQVAKESSTTLTSSSQLDTESSTSSHQNQKTKKKEGDADGGSGEKEAVDIAALLQRRLLADPNFQMESGSGVGGLSQVENKLKQVMMQAMWDVTQEEIEQGRYARVLGFLQEVKERLKGLTPKRTDLQQQVDDALDLDLIQQQMEHTHGGVLGWDIMPLANFIVGWIRMLEAPARNDDTDEWMKMFAERQGAEREKVAKGEATVKDRLESVRMLLDFAHEKLDLISLDSANAYLRSMAPVVKEHGVEIFRKKFQDKLEAAPPGKDVLAKTREFGNKVLSFLRETRGEEVCQTVVELHRAGIMELVLPGGVFELELRDEETVYVQRESLPFPETLEEDKGFLTEMFMQARRLWRTGYAFLRIRQIVFDATPEMLIEILTILSADVNRYAVQPSEGMDNGSKTVIARLGPESESKLMTQALVEGIKKHRALDQVDEEALAEVLRKGLNFQELRKERTFGLVNARLRDIFFELIVPRNSQRQAASAGLRQALAKISLAPMEQQVLSLANSIFEFASRDYAIHGTRGYDAVFPNPSVQVL